MSTDTAQANPVMKVTPTTAEHRQAVTASTAPLLVIDRQGGQPYLMPRSDLNKPTPQDEKRFRRLADECRRQTFFSSSITDNLYHPAYLTIIAMGEKGLSLILQELEARGGQWATALRYIVDREVYPDKPDDIGKPKELKEAWLEWGRRNNYL